MLPDIEIVAAKVHETWMQNNRIKGITSRVSDKGEEQMVPYSELSESGKELDRTMVRTVYAAISAALINQ